MSKPKMETSGSIVGKMHGKTTIRARVLDSDGNVLEDLGVIVGERTKEQGDRTRAALARLKANFKGGKNHGRR